MDRLTEELTQRISDETLQGFQWTITEGPADIVLRGDPPGGADGVTFETPKDATDDEIVEAVRAWIVQETGGGA